MPQLEASPTIDFQTETYKDAYSRINAIVIEGEQEAHDNYLTLAELLADKKSRVSWLVQDGEPPHERLPSLWQES